MKEYIDRLAAAQRYFDWAVDPLDVDAAIFALKAAELALSSYVKSFKKNRENGKL